MAGNRRRSWGRHAAGREPVAPERERPLDEAVLAAREEGRAEHAARSSKWLRHPNTIDEVAALLYEARTGRRWLGAEEIDRIAYIANARAIVEFLVRENPS